MITNKSKKLLPHTQKCVDGGALFYAQDENLSKKAEQKRVAPRLKGIVKDDYHEWGE